MDSSKYMIWSGRIGCLTLSARSLSIITLTICFVFPDAVHSATNTVISLADSGVGSLRQAIADAAPGDTINFGVAGIITLTNGDLVIARNVSVLGPGSSALAISASRSNRIFRIESGVSAMITDLTIRDGKARDGANGSATWEFSSPGGPGEPGGAILTAGTLALLNCVVTNNRAGNGGDGARWEVKATAGGAGGAGGAIDNSGVLSVSNCVISGNASGNAGVSAISTWRPASGPGGNGGAIHNTGTLVLNDSLIVGNAAGSVTSAPSDTDGIDGSSGGGVWNGGYFSASRCMFSANIAGTGSSGGGGNPVITVGGQGGFGGGICSTGAMALTDCTVRENACGDGGTGGSAYLFSGGGTGGRGGLGGGVYAIEGVLIGCTVVSNRAGTGGPGGPGYNSQGSGPGNGGPGGDGGGIAFGGGELLLTNCTLVGNAAGKGGPGNYTLFAQSIGGSGGSGGGLFLSGTSLVAVACTIVDNSPGLGGTLAPIPFGVPGPDGRGGGAYQRGSGNNCDFLNNIVARNTGLFPDVLGTFHSLGHNLVGATNGSTGFGAPGDLSGSMGSPLDPKVAPLADNGGPTLTMALLPGSLAIEAGAAVGLPATDQRGISRPQGERPDIGAYESQFTIPLITDARFQSVSFFSLQSLGLPNQVYTLQASTNLVHWFDVTNGVANSNGRCELYETVPGDCTTRLYRMRLSAP